MRALVFLLLIGCTRAERHPSAVPGQPVAATAVVDAAPPADAAPAAMCLPVASCQCFRGECAAVVPTTPQRGRVLGGRLDGHTVMRSHSCPGADAFSQVTRCLDWVDEAEVCTGACVLADPGYQCGFAAGVCKKS